MGQGDSKLLFKKNVLKLAERNDVPANDPYWAQFWQLPESQDDIFSLFSPSDIRRIRDEAFGNLETLILAVTSRLNFLVHHANFPHDDLAPERDALNCIRVLTRLLPYVYEADHLEAWEDRFFWGSRRRRVKTAPQGASDVLFDGQEIGQEDDATIAREPEYEDAKPLAEELVDNLIDLLFFSGWTIPRVPGKSKVSFTIWQSGVGCNNPVASTQEMESRRMEVLRLLLTMTSKSIYTATNILPVQGIKAITYITTIPDKQLNLTLLCSLLNTSLKYNPATWRVPYDHVVFKDSKQEYVTYCLQLLLVLVLYPVPETADGIPPKNHFRYFLGRLHRPQDFQFLVDGMTRILNQPLQATTSYLPGSQKSLTWSPEMIMLFWEVLQCNKRFRSFIVETDRAHDFVVLILFHAIQNKDDPSKQGVVRMCIFVLQTLSSEATFGTQSNKQFHGQDTLPQVIRIANFHGTYGDFLIMSIHTLITTSHGKNDAIYPALLAIINNVAPHLTNLSPATSSKLVQLFASMSSPSFLLANETNYHLLRALLEAINALLEHQYETNAAFVFAVVRAHKRFQALRDFAISGGQAELDRQALSRKEAAEGPEGRSSTHRKSSLDSIRSPGSIRSPSLTNVPEEGGAFAIGDDDDSDDDTAARDTPTASSRPSADVSRTASMADDDANASLPTQLRGMSEKARGKMPAHQSSFSRQTSNASLSSMTPLSSTAPGGNFNPSAVWIDNWLMELPLHTTMTVIEHLLPNMPAQGASSTTSAALRVIRETRVVGLEPSLVRIHLFQWSPLSLGWYESLLWSFIVSTEVTMLKGAPGMWQGTKIRLFRVQETAAPGPTLLAPQGAIDSVGSNLVKRFESLIPGSPTRQRNSVGGNTRVI